MPYIDEDSRITIDYAINRLKSALVSNFGSEDIDGALNYTITELLDVIPHASSLSGDWRYKYINRAVGTLENVKQEFYRRLAGPYEDKAIKKNGDINSYADFNNSSK